MKPLWIIGFLAAAAWSSPEHMARPVPLGVDTAVPPAYLLKVDNIFDDPRVQAIPDLGYKKVSAILDTLKDTIDPLMPRALDNPSYFSLSLREKFDYNMRNFEQFSQICSYIPGRLLEPGDKRSRIYATLPPRGGDVSWSERQRKFFITNKDSVETLVKTIIALQGRVSERLKWVIFDINGKSLMPILIETYKYQPEPKDPEILTLLMLLMDTNRNPAFMRSALYQKLYGKKAHTYSAYVPYTKSTENIILNFCQ